MNPFTQLVLPQNDTPENRARREQVLVEQQALYRFDYNTTTLAGLPMAATPIPIELSLVWAAGLMTAKLAAAENLLNIVLPNVIDFDLQIPLKIGTAASGTMEASLPPPSHVDRREADKAARANGLASGPIALAADVARFKQDLDEARAELAGLANLAATSGTAPPPAVEQRVLSWLKGFTQTIEELLGKDFGVYGRPTDLYDYQRQFRTVPLPWTVGVYQTDEIFAQMRVAGPNPLVIRQAKAPDLAGLSLGSHAASIEEALRQKALFVADYSVLQSLEPGTNPAQKYVFMPKAFFVVAASGKRSLCPVAIVPSSGAKPLFPGDGPEWEIAKSIVNMADGNYHELISHLGLTHLLTEPFVITTHRQLDPEHPLYVLLRPHFAGTLYINYGAQTQLVADGGGVDKLLTGTIESSRQLSASAVTAVRYNKTFLPLALAARGVDDPATLPDYPYRDDALAVWNAIHAWVTAYLNIYYPTASDVTGDYELQAWVAELASKQGGSIQDIGDHQVDGTPRIATAEYLAKLLTQVIFTASAQHAAVNFPQSTIMAYTPAMPLAAYAPFPAQKGKAATQILDILPPLQMGLLQQVLLTTLGSVHYTTLGQYGGELATLQVQDALRAFQQELQRIEVDINRKNTLGERTSYTTLLPSLIPQSINI